MDDSIIPLGFNPAFGLRPLQTPQVAAGENLLSECFNPAFGLRPLQTQPGQKAIPCPMGFQSRVRAQAASDLTASIIASLTGEILSSARAHSPTDMLPLE